MKDENIDEWTLDGVLDEVSLIDSTMPDRQFAFILGAGASFTSGIPTGKTLAEGWLKELHRRECHDGTTFDIWVSSPAHGINGLTFESAAEHYPKIFDRRFRHDREAGYAALEQAMDSKSPSLGYSLLAEIIQSSRHKVVVTTNFDNLVADALAMHAHKSPLVVAHESLANFVRPHLRRPLIAKIHRDLFLEPQNDEVGVGTLDKAWATALRKLFQYYTPIVIGYGGNDGSLMGLLDSLNFGEISGRMIWCYRDDLPNENALRVIKKHHGILVKIPGFDDLLLRLAEKLIKNFDVTAIADNIERLGAQRSKQYREQSENLQKASARGSIEQQKTGEVLIRSAEAGKSWWAWELKARDESNVEARDSIYRQGLKQFPNSAPLMGSYATFLTEELKKHEQAEMMFNKALSIDPTDSNVICGLAIFLAEHRKDYERVSDLYRTALELDPTDTLALVNYANFLLDHMKNYDLAESMYVKAIELDPSDATAIGNYANLLSKKRDAFDKAESMYERALELDPSFVRNIANYVTFLIEERKNYTKAESVLNEFSKVNPEDAELLVCRALVFEQFHNDYDKAEAAYKRAVELAPDDTHTLQSYAEFLNTKRKDYKQAEALHKKVLEIEPESSDNIANLASMKFCKSQPGALDEVPELLKRATLLFPVEPSQVMAEVLLYSCLYSELTTSSAETQLAELKRFLNGKFDSSPWDFSHVFESVLQDVAPERRDLYQALGEVILDQKQLPILESFQAWIELEDVEII
ncbi:tetratricopeptide repeat protein [Pseudomonas monteilii]|uniref:tetratricopeptide repeat protein n=1 Tax=Pseudomonas monteilii TaxID=76759 RepID=UPI0013772900|nr:tetratricopeptide repeat protein [Pseudomonas monteilii]NBB02905.1 tetratricopeptide repeat protein [Pseudomonas monteilii]